MKNEIKNKVVRLRVTQKEYDLLVKNANSVSLCISEYILSKTIINQLEIFDIPIKESLLEKSLKNLTSIDNETIVKIHLSGVGFSELAEGLNKKGFKTFKGLAFSANNLSKIFQKFNAMKLPKVEKLQKLPKQRFVKKETVLIALAENEILEKLVNKVKGSYRIAGGGFSVNIKKYEKFEMLFCGYKNEYQTFLINQINMFVFMNRGVPKFIDSEFACFNYFYEFFKTNFFKEYDIKLGSLYKKGKKFQ